MGGVARRIDLDKMGTAALVALALCLIALGISRTQTGDDDPSVIDPAVEAQVPRPGDLVLRQSQVGVDLAPEYTGYLVIDGIRIPDDQAFIDPALNQVFYTPHEGGDIEEFAPGTHRIEARFWKIAEDETTSRPVFWSFRVS